MLKLNSCVDKSNAQTIGKLIFTMMITGSLASGVF